MSTPVVENIALALVALIDGITIANGFNQTLNAIRPKRIHLESDLYIENNAFVLQGEGGVLIDASEVAHWVEEFIIQVIVLDSDDATTAIDTKMNQISADIQKQFKRNDNWKLNGYSKGIDIVKTERSIGVINETPQSYIDVTINVHMEYLTADPHSLG